MSEKSWAEIDRWFIDALEPRDEVLEAALRTSEAAGLPPYQVSAAQGRMLFSMARMVRARTILEVGTLGGYSTIWLARALPEGGRLITCEADPKHAAVARENLARARLSHVVELREGRAQETLPRLRDEGRRFDFAFIDADKPSNAEYFDLALAMATPGAAIVVDNVVRRGAVIDADNADPNIEGVRRLRERVRNEVRVHATVVQTVGEKGHDGFLLAVMR